MLLWANGASGPAEIVKSKRRKCLNLLTAQLRSSSFETPRLLNEDYGALHSVLRTYVSPHFCNSELGIIHLHISAIRTPELCISASLQFGSGIMQLRIPAIRNLEPCISASPQFEVRNYAFPYVCNSKSGTMHHRISAIRTPEPCISASQHLCNSEH